MNPFISTERLKIETSYLVNASNITGTSQLVKLTTKVSMVGSHDLHFKLTFPSITFENIKQHDAKFLCEYTLSADEKIYLSKWAWLRSRDPFEKFGTRLYLRIG